MKFPIVINQDSFVGVITNSSSELFVLETEKSLEFVERVIGDLIKVYNKNHGTHYSYKKCFKPAQLCPYNFDYFHKDIPQGLRDRYDNLIPEGLPFLDPWSTNDNWGENYKKEREYIKSGMTEIEAQWKANLSNRTIMIIEFQLFVHFLKQNGLEHLVPDFLAKAKEFLKESRKERQVYANIYFDESDPLYAPWEIFDMATSWGLTLNENSIWVQTIEDNSAPYELFGAINSFLNGNNWHLG